MKEKVSVIVAIYNTSNYLEQCVHSLMTQTYDNFEIIFIDDASTDDSLDLLKKILSEYPQHEGKCVIIENNENKGIGHCRRIGMKKACGSYVIHVDSDDYVDSAFLEKLVNKAQVEDADIVICNRAEVIGNRINNIFNKHVENKSELIKRLLIGSCHNALWNKLIKKKIFTDNDIYPEDIFRNLEDKSIMFKCVYSSNKIVYVDDVLYYYRKYENSLTMDSQRKLLPIVDRLTQLVDEFFSTHQSDSIIAEGIELFKIGAAATNLLYGGNVDQDVVRRNSISDFFKNTYIPSYYKIALISYKYHMPFVVKILQTIISFKGSHK